MGSKITRQRFKISAGWWKQPWLVWMKRLNSKMAEVVNLVHHCEGHLSFMRVNINSFIHTACV